jgi:hypothetical protein
VLKRTLAQKKPKWAEVIMGMAQPLSANSDTSGATLAKNHTNALNAHYPGKYNFIIGHLINEQFGCIQKDGNFVPLTSSANSQHKNAIETPIANFLTAMSGIQGDKLKLNRALDEDGITYLGIGYKVTSSAGSWGTTAPDCYVPNSITWELELGVFKNGSKKTRLTNPEIQMLEGLRIAARRFISNLSSNGTAKGTIENTK